MIRKDVKLGFAIGGVLLAVLVVYVLVGTGGDERAQNNGAGIVTEDSPPAVASHADTSGGSPAPSNSHDTTAPTGGATADALRSGTRAPPGAAPTTPAPSPSTPPSHSEVAAKDQQPDANRDLWGKALNEGQLLLSETPTPVGGMSARSSSGAGTTANSSSTGVPQGDNTAVVGDDARPRVTDASPMFGSGPSTQPLVADIIDSRSSRTGSNASNSTGARTHVIQKGETLAKISEVAYGSANYYPHILRANPGLDPKKLKPGMTINLPPSSDVKPAASDSSTGGPTSVGLSATARTPVDPRTEYRVESTDSLYKIAMKLYGKPAMVDKLYEVNKETIGPDRGKLKLNMVLKLPEPPTQTAAR